ncbi:MAG: DUF4280 domain-containing protein [Nitrospirae bacterium]|nr:MAG: DUF4280 domain-containing protein [Nitrospirota bacterium]
MPQQVSSGAQLRCTFGTAPSQLVVTPDKRVDSEKRPVATVMDFVPQKNIMPFGMCSAPSNPQVQAAHAPVPCIPATTSPWTPGASKVMVGKLPSLSSNSMCTCMWAGQITVQNAGQQTVSIT